MSAPEPIGPHDVAVVICTRDRSELLREALEAVARHTPPEVDVVIVDSASRTSATREVAAATPYRYVRTDIAGVSIARNVGIAATDRAVIVFTDDDCLPAPGWIETIAADFGTGVGAVTGAMRHEGDPVRDERRTWHRPVEGLDAGHGALMAFQRDLLLDLGGFDDVLGAGRHWGGAEDLDMFCRVLESGASIVYDPDAAVDHVNRREDDDYVRLHAAYGRGLGAMASKWVRSRPGPGLRLAVRILGRNVKRVVRLRRDRRRGPAERAFLRGFLGAGLAALGHRVRDFRFVDAAPPAPITLERSGRG
jgi:glycosyltransferase involved in cell wall biosynthesis